VNRPRPDSQSGRILQLLESANGGKVSLLAILNLRISQYSARIHDLRHKYGFRIENGSELGHPERACFRLVQSVPAVAGKLAEMSRESRLFPSDSHRDLG
jgi:Helix-turn-helix domain